MKTELMLRREKKMTNLFSRPGSPSLVFFFSKKKKKKKKCEEEEEISFQTIKENNLITSNFSLDFLFNPVFRRCTKLN